MAIEHADFEGIERLAAVLGAEIVSTFDNPEGVKIGKCDLIEEIMIGEDKVMRFSGVQQGQACSLVLRGATEQVKIFITRICTAIRQPRLKKLEPIENTRFLLGFVFYFSRIRPF